FSSRRRHTSYIGDWSSDVCSSDLRLVLGGNEKNAEGLDHGEDHRPQRHAGDRKSVVKGKSVDLGGRRIIKKKKKYTKQNIIHHKNTKQPSPTNQKTHNKP